ncbi:MAG: hypothetical protein CVT66_04865 [Actinobacteria bacterium HGW-Actinobacteria-6]|nr:MAG: hypothetical protein CVT66_04865 [Actinobacteria bacterium HGW-Actinobacteria-6]
MAGVVVAVALTVGGLALVRQGTRGFLPAEPTSAVAEAAGATDGHLGVKTAPKVTDIPIPPSSIAEKVAENGTDSLSTGDREAWDRYLSETAAVVSDNASGLTARLDAAMQAIAAGDDEALSAMLAPDENPQAEFIESLAAAYPTIGTSDNQDSVGIFSAAKVTVYFGYSVVSWTDGGIESEHTVAVPMRFIDGTWYITSVGIGTTGLVSVQTVRI